MRPSVAAVLAECRGSDVHADVVFAPSLDSLPTGAVYRPQRP